MPFTVMITDGQYELSGWSGLASRRAAEDRIDELAERARRDAKSVGLNLAEYQIVITEHANDCPGACPDELGHSPQCRAIAEYPLA